MTVVKTKKGPVSGVPMEGYTVFKGIPYAKPPVGELRWRAPQQMDGWTQVYQADGFSNRSAQMANRTEGFYDKEFFDEAEYETPLSEDCLYLNIWTPAEGEGEKLPVAFWIHGGAFLGGYGHEKEFDGAAYCKRGVILVTINYRLGPLGFLVHPWLIGENERGIAGNYGILDQIAALRWVYENISAFGGDPGNITVFGQSAGAMSAQTLVSSPLTENMIAKAIFQSAGGYGCSLNRDMMPAEAAAYGEELASNAKTETLEELRALPFEQVLRYAAPIIEKGFSKDLKLPYAPVIDGYVLEDGYDSSVLKGGIKDIPYMLGSTKNDITVTPEMVARGEYGPVYHGCCQWSLQLEKLGRRPAYVYYFTRDLPGDQAGAFHSSELWYMFGTLHRAWRPMEDGDYLLSERMLDCWTNFMKTGDPGAPGMDFWMPYTEKIPCVQLFDIVLPGTDSQADTQADVSMGV